MSLEDISRIERSKILQQFNWNEIYPKFINRKTSIETFIIEELTPLLGFTISISTINRYINNYKKGLNNRQAQEAILQETCIQSNEEHQVSVVILDDNDLSVEEATEETILTITTDKGCSIKIPSVTPELSAVKIIKLLQIDGDI